MACESGLHRNLRRLAVANFAHHQNVRVLAQNGAQPRRKRHAGLDVQLHLPHARHPVLHRIFERHDVHVLAVHQLDDGVEARTFAASRGARGKNHAVGLAGARRDRCVVFRGHAEFGELVDALGAHVQETHHDVFAIGRGNGGDAHVDFVPLHLHRKAPVLREACFRDVHVAHDLDAGHDGSGQLQRHFRGFSEHPLHAVAHVDRGLFGVDVNVRGPDLHAFRENEVHETNDRHVVHAGGGQVFFVPRRRFAAVVLRERPKHFGKRAVLAVDCAEKAHEVRLRAEHGLHLAVAVLFDVVQSAEVVGIQKRAVENAPVKRDGDEAVFSGDVPRKEVLQGGIERVLVRVVKRDVELHGKRLEDFLLRDDSVAHEVFAQLFPGSL